MKTQAFYILFFVLIFFGRAFSQQKPNNSIIENNLVKGYDLVNSYLEQKQGLGEICKSLNTDYSKVVGEINLSEHEIKKYFDDNYYYSEENSIFNFIQKQLESGKITKNEFKVLKQLDASMSKTKSDLSALKIIEKELELKIDKYALNKAEKNKILFISKILKSEYTYSLKKKKLTCNECIHKRKWLIFGMAAITGAGGLACVVFSSGTLTPACYATVAVLWAAEIMAICPMCIIPNHNNCQTCPPSPYWYDSSNCYSGTQAPSGTNPFVWQNKFYYNANGSGCSIGQYYDGAHCYFGNVPNGYIGFIYNNGFYVTPKCP